MIKHCQICKRPVPKQEPGDDTAHCPDCDVVFCEEHMQTHKRSQNGYRCENTIDWVDNCPPVVAN